MAKKASEQKIVTENARLERKVSSMYSSIIHDRNLRTAGQSEIIYISKYIQMIFLLSK
jgi:hypothetical protein